MPVYRMLSFVNTSAVQVALSSPTGQLMKTSLIIFVCVIANHQSNHLRCTSLLCVACSNHCHGKVLRLSLLL